MPHKVRTKNVLNVETIYFFSKKGLDISGIITADLSLNGRESCATTGQHSKLDNKDTPALKNIEATTTYFPSRFISGRAIFSLTKKKCGSGNFMPLTEPHISS